MWSSLISQPSWIKELQDSENLCLKETGYLRNDT